MRIHLSDPTIGEFVLDENFQDLKASTLNRFFSFGVKTPSCFGVVFRKEGDSAVWLSLDGKIVSIKSFRELPETYLVTQIYGARIEAF